MKAEIGLDLWVSVYFWNTLFAKKAEDKSVCITKSFSLVVAEIATQCSFY